MSKFSLGVAGLTGLAVVMGIFLTGCPLPPTVTTFSIKLNNTGQSAITGAYFAEFEGKATDWGDNLLEKPLQPFEYVIIEGLPRREYDFRVTFDALDEEEQPVERVLYENWAPSHGLEFATWHASYNADDSWGLGYSWGYNVYDNEIPQSDSPVE